MLAHYFFNLNPTLQLMIQKDCIFDTRVDTNRIYVSMNTKFIIRNYLNEDNLSPLYLHITGDSKRERLNLDVLVDPKHWNKKKQRLKTLNAKFKDINLILDNVDSKITNIKTVYRLSEQILTPATLKLELINDLPRVNFCTFFEYSLKEQKSTLKPGTYRRHNSVLNKLKAYNDEIFFNQITLNWFLKYRKHLHSIGNVETTINSNIKSIKKFLAIAVKLGIKIPCNLNDIVSGSTLGNRTALKPEELKKIFNFYKSEFVNPPHKLVLGYFLFSCMTGLRFSDIMSLTRKDLMDQHIHFVTKKTGKDQMISLNKKAKEIVETSQDLFITKYTNEHINRELKVIMGMLGIRKKITFHVARHTFATSFLRMGGRVEKLQMLLGHGDIKQTMIYVHIVAEEANKSIFLLDDLF